MVGHLLDIAGGTVASAPSIADLENPELRPYVEKYLQGAAGVSGEYRLRLFHLIRNLTADEWGGREAVSWLKSGGGVLAQRTVLRNRIDMAAARDLALDFGGLGSWPRRGEPEAVGAVAVVTGGTRSIGAAISERLLDDGSVVIAVYGQMTIRPRSSESGWSITETVS